MSTAIESPYKFLDYYDIQDQQRFFGRERETNILVADTVVNRLVVLFARTGTGKTSLINAGVRPLLEARDFRTFYIRVEQNPSDAARDVLQKEGLLKEDTGETPLSAQLASVVEALEKSIVLFFDQFEEFFIQIRDRQTRQNFITDIAEIYRNTESGVHLVFSMREEYFHEMDEFRSEIPSIFHKNSNLRLLPLEASQARDAILKPAAASGVTIEPPLVAALLKDLAQEAGISPTSLQIVCDTLWRNRDPSSDRITLEEYQALGGWRRILDQRLETDIEAALADTGLLSLMLHLIPELRTERNTKYPRVISDLIKTLDTNERTLRELIARLKGIHVIRELTISGAHAIEWSSDYLAERTEYLLVRVKAIELKRLLQAALLKAKETKANRAKDPASTQDRLARYVSDDILDTLYLPVQDFERLSQDAALLTGLDIEATTFLFEAALFHRLHMKPWFDQAASLKLNPWDILREKLHDLNAHINLRLGTVRLLAELGTDQALLLLGEALDEPDLALEVVDILVDIPGEQASKLIAKALEREDLWEATLIALTRTGSERAVLLLEPLLDQESRFFPVLNALERLAKSTSSQTGKSAVSALRRAVTVLESFLQREYPVDRAESALESLALSGHGHVAAEARQALERLDSSQEEKPAPVEGAPRFGSLRESSPREWDRLIKFISQGKLVPIISNSFRLEHIFAGKNGLGKQTTHAPDPGGEPLPVEAQLTREWAHFIEYPMPDVYNLARVAQYYLVVQADYWAKADYLDFLKRFFLDFSESQGPDADEVVSQLKKQSKEMRFSDIVRQLDYPRFPSDVQDPLRLLARFPLPIYVTTSPYDFLERALEAEGKRSRTQVILWGGWSDIKPEHNVDPEYYPSPTEPVVYHLYGLEDYPYSLVLSEDDYLSFLKQVNEDTNTQQPIVPLRLRQAIAESSLLLLGYDQQEWNFRVLFSLISNSRRSNISPRSLVVLGAPDGGDAKTIERLLEYWLRYFDRQHFGVEWGAADQVVQKLWDEWEKYYRQA